MNQYTAIPYEDIYLIVDDCQDFYETKSGETSLIDGWEVTKDRNGLHKNKWRRILYQSSPKFPGVPLFKIPWGEDVEKLADEYLRKNAPWIQEKNYSDAIIDFTFGYNAHASTHRWSDEDVFNFVGAAAACSMQGGSPLDAYHKVKELMKQPPSYTVTLGETFEGVQLIDKYEKI